MNVLSIAQSQEISQLFKVIADPFRIQLLLVLSDNEACVCHLECLLGKRQSYISQHLMSLREAGFLKASRKGKYIFYSLKDRGLLKVIQRAAVAIGMPEQTKAGMANNTLSKCQCPNCGASKLIAIE